MDAEIRDAVVDYLKSDFPVALTGAGISVDSGIPDFRSQDGLWNVFDPWEYATIEAFRASPQKAWMFYRSLARRLRDARPNPAHEALASLEIEGRLNGIITQNIDGLHLAAGSRNVVEVHGDARRLQCLHCARLTPASADQYSSQEVPACNHCGNPLKPNVVLFGEGIRLSDRSSRLLDRCDLLLVVGTSAEVFPVADFPRQVLRRDGKLIEFNVRETALSFFASHGIYGPAAETVPEFVESALKLL
ncbi:MAG TPA: Sir2 family NAD-dependent protein deacetylase [Acidobacteriota bacterium]|nr:Sir2 family NAD-dependent protein deacetylase [Acidobacteriota bacterium]